MLTLCALRIGAQTTLCATDDRSLAEETQRLYPVVQSLRAEHRFDEAYLVAVDLLTAIDVRTPDAARRTDRTGVFLAQMQAYLHFAASDLARNQRHWAAAHHHLDAVVAAMSILTGGSYAPSAWDVRILNLRGDLFLASGSPERAEPAYRAALSAANEVLDEATRAALLLDCERRQGRLLLASADARAALDAAQRALSAVSDADPRRATLLHDLGLAAEYAALERGEASDDAVRWQTEALALASAGGLRDDAHIALARLALRAGELDAASEYLGAVTSPGRRLSRLSARLARLRGDAEGVERAAVDLEQHFAEMVAGWHARPLDESGVAHLHFARDRALLAEMAAVDIARHAPEEGARRLLERLLQAGAASTLDRKIGTALPALEDVLAALSPGHGLLVYLPTSTESSFVVVATSDAVEVAEIPSHYEVEARRTRWVDALRAGARSLSNDGRARAIADERRLARAFSECVLPEDIVRLVETCTRLTLVAHDALGFVPFGWVPCGRHDYLGVGVALDMWPTLSLGHHLCRDSRRGDAPLRVLFIGGAERSLAQRSRWPRLDDLPDPGQVVDDLAQLIPVVDVRPAVGRDAAWAGLQSRLDDHDLATWIVHGVRDARRDRPVGLLIEETQTHDGVVWCEDVEVSAAPRAVAMLACRVGTGAARRGDAGSATMAGAWLAAGSQVVIEAQADLRFSDAVHVSRVLHRALAAGVSPAEALRRARADAVERLGGEAPFRDGLLQAIGAGHVPLINAPAVTSSSPSGSWFRVGALVATALLVTLAVGARLSRQ